VKNQHKDREYQGQYDQLCQSPYPDALGVRFNHAPLYTSHPLRLSSGAQEKSQMNLAFFSAGVGSAVINPTNGSFHLRAALSNLS
jgi:hypothetical protein